MEDAPCCEILRESAVAQTEVARFERALLVSELEQRLLRLRRCTAEAAPALLDEILEMFSAAPTWPQQGRKQALGGEIDGYIIYVVCTHLGCLFQWRPTENRFICPCHGSQFSRTGEYLAGPAPRSLDSFVVRVVDAQGNLLVETPPEADGNGPVPTPVPDPEVQIIVDTGRRLFGKHK